eukprot:10690937-Alexandrium_andersonii.AAC.1
MDDALALWVELLGPQGGSPRAEVLAIAVACLAPWLVFIPTDSQTCCDNLGRIAEVASCLGFCHWACCCNGDVWAAVESLVWQRG